MDVHSFHPKRVNLSVHTLIHIHPFTLKSVILSVHTHIHIHPFTLKSVTISLHNLHGFSVNIILSYLSIIITHSPFRLDFFLSSSRATSPCRMSFYLSTPYKHSPDITGVVPNITNLHQEKIGFISRGGCKQSYLLTGSMHKIENI